MKVGRKRGEAGSWGRTYGRSGAACKREGRREFRTGRGEGSLLTRSVLLLPFEHFCDELLSPQLMPRRPALPRHLLLHDNLRRAIEMSASWLACGELRVSS